MTHLGKCLVFLSFVSTAFAFSTKSRCSRHAVTMKASTQFSTEEWTNMHEELERRGSIESSPVFSGLGKSNLARLAATAHEVHMSPREVLFRQGHKADSMFIVKSGYMELVEKSGHVVHVARAGELFGELGVLFRKPRALSAVAKTRATLWRIEGKDVVESIDNEHDVETGAKAAYSDYFDSFEKAKALRNFRLFRKFAMEDVARIQENMLLEVYSHRELVVQQGDEKVDSMYFVRSGVFECYDESKPDQVLAEVKAGQCFGELGLLLSQARALSVRASGNDASVWKLNKKDFLEDIEDSPVVQATLDYISDKYKDYAWYEVWFNKVSPAGLYELAVTSSRPKKLPVSTHSTFATFVTGAFVLSLTSMLSPGFHRNGMPRLFDSALFDNAIEAKLICLGFAIVAITGVLRLPPNTPKLRRLLFEQTAIQVVLLWVVADSNMVMFNGWNTFDLTGGFGAAFFAALSGLSIFKGAQCMEASITEDEGLDVVLFGNNLLAKLSSATSGFFLTLGIAPLYVFGFDSEKLETLVKPVMELLPGITQSPPLVASGTLSLMMLLATLLFEKKLTQSSELFWLLGVFVLGGLYDSMIDLVDALGSIDSMIPKELHASYLELREYELDAFWGSHLLQLSVVVYVIAVVSGLWKKFGPQE